MTMQAQQVLPGFCVCGQPLPDPVPLPNLVGRMDVVGHECDCGRYYVADITFGRGEEWELSRDTMPWRAKA